MLHKLFLFLSNLDPCMSSSFNSSLILYFLIQACLFSSQLIEGCLISDRSALLQFRSRLNDPENRLSTWKGTECCSWRGVSCDNQTGSVTAINLQNPYPNSATSHGFWNLSGTFDPSLLHLKSLAHLDLSYNTFKGIQIPEFFGSLNELRYLNLSEAGFTGAVPPQIGNLTRLHHLDLSSSESLLRVDDFQWVSELTSLEFLSMNSVDLSMAGLEWFQALNMLSSLRELHLSDCRALGISKTLPLINLTSLQVLDLSFNTFNSVIPNWVSNLSSLRHLDLQNAAFLGQVPELWSISNSIKYIDMSTNNNLTADITEFFRGNWKQLEILQLGSNRFHGFLPDSIGNLTSLVELNLFDNNIVGGIPSSIGKICNLKRLNLDANNLNLGLPGSLEIEGCLSDKPLQSLDYFSASVNKIGGSLPNWLGELANLTVLNLAYNMITGSVPPSLGNLSLLTELRLDGNKINGTLPSTLGYLSELRFLGLSTNELTGFLNEGHFLKLGSLKILLLSSNSFVLNVSSSWIAPFQIRNLDMGSCRLGPEFPSWLRNQRELRFLDVSNASISGKIPNWLWDLSSNLSLLNMSFNKLDSQIPNPMKTASFADVDLRNNLLTGSIPTFLTNIELLDLSHNQFSGTIPFNFGMLQPYIVHLSFANNNLTGTIPASIGDLKLLQIIDLSYNYFIGPIPSSLQNCSYLKALVLDHNSLSGPIPSSLSSLVQLQSLHLSNNGFSGLIPQSLQNCTRLETLDLGNNNLSGSIPAWLGNNNLSALRILVLRSNKLTGPIPFQHSDLKSLQVLDLANNLLSGEVPGSLGYWRAMINNSRSNAYLFYGDYRGTYYEESVSIHSNNGELTYTKTLSLLTCIDLSGNSLSGEIPQMISNLSGLIILNLSKNNLTGEIPSNIGDMYALEALDLSNNHFIGSLPVTMSSLTFLSKLNLSNNNFSGRIPPRGQLSTFAASSYSGNRFLCGPPLENDCEENGVSGNGISKEDDGEDDNNLEFGDEWFYLSAGVGYAVGLLGLVAVVFIRKPWCDSYLEFIDWLVYRFHI